MGRPPSSWKLAHSLPPEKIFTVNSPNQIFMLPRHQRFISPSSPLNNYFHVITHWKLVINSCSLYSRVMLVLVLNEAVFGFEKGANGQNHSSSGSYCPVKKFSPSKISGSPTPVGSNTTFHPLALFGKPWYIKRPSLVYWY